MDFSKHDIFIACIEPHKYQLRVYIYQARDVMAKDSEGVSGKFILMSAGY